MNVKTDRILIAGAGLVGPVLALFLRRRGFTVDLFERRESLVTGGGRSINLVITSRGLNALEQLLLLNDVRKLIVPVRGRMMHSPTGELTYQAYGRDPTECNYSVSRTDLNQALVAAAVHEGVRVHYGHELTSVNLKKREAAFKTAPASTGIAESKKHFEVLFAADGAGSEARKALADAGCGGHTDWLSSDYKELIIPAEHAGKLDKNALHIWPRGTHMMMALPNITGDFTVTLYQPQTGHQFAFDQLKERAQVEAMFKTEYADAVPLMPTYLDDFFSNPQGKLGTVRCEAWTDKRSVCLIGDAAHAIVPFFGQGMNLGFEDCTTLARILTKTKSWPEAFALFDAEQRPNANAIAEMALENFVEMRDKVGQPNFLLRKKTEAWLETNYPELYRSRYGMITYTLIPYAIAQEAGRIQDRIIDELLAGKNELPTDLEKARMLIAEHLEPFYKKHSIDVQRWVPKKSIF